MTDPSAPDTNVAISAGSKIESAVFITFSGNCRKALAFYQACFGGTLHLETFDGTLEGYTEMPVVSGSLVSNCITIYGSDLVYPEGRIIGNYLSVFLYCRDKNARRALIEKLRFGKQGLTANDDQKLVEITDVFDVRWILSI